MATARKLPSGNYRCLVFVGKSDDCKSGYKSFTAPTKKEAEKMAASFEEEMCFSKLGKITIGNAVDQYIEAKQNVLSPATIKAYKSIRKHRLQSIMQIPVQMLKKAQLQAAFNKESVDLSPKTLRNIYGLYSGAMNLIEEKPFKITLPMKEQKEIQIPTKEEVLKLIEFSDGEFQIAIMLAAYLGLSRSEICGLCIKDCKEEVHIEKAVVQDENNNWVTKQPKEFSRYRTIVLPDIIKEKINELNKKDDDKLIEITPNAIGRRFDRLTQKVCGKRYGFHALRHYNVSVMLALNVPSKYIIDRTGHSTMRMVDRVYGHAISAKQKEVSSKITDYFENIQHEIQHVK